MNSAIRRPRSIHYGAVTSRMIIFLAIVSLPLLWFGYVFVNETLTGGIRHYADYAEVDLKALGCFPFDDANGKLSDVPSRFRALDGMRVALTGYMNSVNGAGNHISSFEFVYNRTICCTSGPPRVEERVYVNVPNGDVPYTYDLVRIEGTLHVKVVKEEGIVKSVYTLDLAKVDPL